MVSFAWLHIFREFKYLINALLVEACGNFKLDISWEEVFHGKFHNSLAGSESKRNPNFETSAFPTTGNTRLHLASVLNTPPTEGSKVTQNCKTTARAENSLQRLSAHSALAQTFPEVQTKLNLLPQGWWQNQQKWAQTQQSWWGGKAAGDERQCKQCPALCCVCLLLHTALAKKRGAEEAQEQKVVPHQWPAAPYTLNWLKMMVFKGVDSMLGQYFRPIILLSQALP